LTQGQGRQIGPEPVARPRAWLDDAPVIAAVEGLSADEQGAVLGLARAGASPQAAARLEGAAGVRCRTALEALAGLPEGARAAELVALAGLVTAPVPAGLERVHPGWLRRALQDESEPVLRAVADGLPAEVGRVVDEILGGRGEDLGPPRFAPAASVIADLRRILFSGLVPMPADGSGQAIPLARALCALSTAALVEEIDRRGAATLGLALRGAPAEAVARAAAGVGEPLARVVISAAKGATGGLAEARAWARALVESVPPEEAVRGVTRAVGLRAVAHDLAGEGGTSLAAVAQRLPPTVGDALLACRHALSAVGSG
jgi:hypothetical protein